MAFTWALDGRHDLVISNGRLTTVGGTNEVRQRILVSLLHHWGEYFLNVQGGVPWKEVILGSKDKKLVVSIIRRAILNVPGVIGVVQLDFVRGSSLRHYDLYAVVEVEGVVGATTFGTEMIELQQTLAIWDDSLIWDDSQIWTEVL